MRKPIVSCLQQVGDEDNLSLSRIREDPIYEVSNWLWDTGHKVTTKLYSNYRHEIHNECDIRDEVVDGIISFIDGVL